MITSAYTGGWIAYIFNKVNSPMDSACTFLSSVLDFDKLVNIYQRNRHQLMLWVHEDPLGLSHPSFYLANTWQFFYNSSQTTLILFICKGLQQILIKRTVSCSYYIVIHHTWISSAKRTFFWTVSPFFWFKMKKSRRIIKQFLAGTALIGGVHKSFLLPDNPLFSLSIHP